MSDELVQVAIFGSKWEAELATQQLKAGGIDAYVGSDSAGGMIPSLGMAEGHRLLVRSDDVEAAVAVLEGEAADDDPTADEAPSDSED